METGRKQKEKTYYLDLGTNEDLDHELPEIYDIEDRFTHFYLLGASKMGKSTTMEIMAKTDLDYGASVIYIDPKGEAVKRLYHLGDKEKIRYCSADRPICLNPFDKKGYDIDNIIEEFVQVMDVLITLSSINPESSIRMKDLLNNAIKSLNKNQFNIEYLNKFLSYEETRDAHDYPTSELRKYWKAFDKKQGVFWEKKDYHQTADSISSRLSQFINNKTVKQFIVGKNELNIIELVEQGKSLLIDTSQLRPVPRIFISNLIIYSVATYCQYYSLKKPLLVYVDEAQTVASKIFCDILEFGRSACVGFTIAHHAFSQIKKDIIDSILGIVSNYMIFRCGKDEGRTMAEMFDLKPNQFYSLPKYRAWLRIDTNNILTNTHDPIIKEVPDIPPIKETNFLRDAWVCYNENI